MFEESENIRRVRLIRLIGVFLCLRKVKASDVLGLWFGGE